MVPDDFLRALFAAALDAADPAWVLPPYLPAPPTRADRTVVVGAGKGAAAMALAVEAHWPSDARLSGLVITRYGHGVPTRRIEVVEAGHPVPDETGVEAAQRVAMLAQGLSPDDLVLCLLSGGGSALLALPAPGITLRDKREVTAALLASGATISEINAVRKHLSAIKGGRLAAAAHPARVVSLAISDVPGDDPSVIASGPTVGDPTTYGDARAALARYGITPPPRVAAYLEAAAHETPKPGDPIFEKTEFHLVVRPQSALEAAAAFARAAGVTPIILGDSIEGEARQVALVHAGIAREVARWAQPVAPPAVILSGGETTVTVRGSGRGGRNSEFLLGLAIALDGQPGIRALAADTDGIDGTEDNAGALIRPDTLRRAADLGIDPRAALANNDAYRVFAALDDLITTGPTRTNVNDFRAILVESA